MGNYCAAVINMPTLQDCLKVVEELYPKGVAVKDIAKQCGNSMSLVYRAIEKLEKEGKITRRKGKGTRRRLVTEKEIKEIKNRYESGESIYSIAKKLSRPPSTIYYVLKRLGLK